MRSYQAFSDEIDDLDLAVDQIEEQIKTFDLSPKTGCVLYCGSEVNTSELCKKLWDRLHLPFIGTTCLGQFTSNGYREASICLNLFTGEDICFGGGMSGELTSENMIEEIKEAYFEQKKKMDRQEMVIILYVPWYPGVIYDDILDALSEASGGVPIFGGVCSDEWQFDNCYAMCARGSFRNRAAMLLVGGNFNPKFKTVLSINWSSENAVTVTKAKGATVYEIDGQSAVDYFSSVGLEFVHDNVFSDCLASPMIFTYTTPEGEDVRIVRNLFMVNKEDGSVTFAGRVLEGSRMTLALTSRVAIKQSINEPCEELLAAALDDSSYVHSGMIISSCTGRYCLSVADKNAENASLNKAVESGLIVTGGYLNGEFCPKRNPETGKYITLLNNETFTLMIF